MRVVGVGEGTIESASGEVGRADGMKELSGMMEMICILIGRVVTWVCAFVTTH